MYAFIVNFGMQKCTFHVWKGAIFLYFPYENHDFSLPSLAKSGGGLFGQKFFSPGGELLGGNYSDGGGELFGGGGLYPRT